MAKGSPTRFDIHFGGVDLMVLRPYYDGLVIRKGTLEECAEVERLYGVPAEPEFLRVFGEEGDLSSFVVAGRPQWHEDEKEFDEPSWFGRLFGGRMGG